MEDRRNEIVKSETDFEYRFTKKEKRKVISVFLCVLMILGVFVSSFPVSAMEDVREYISDAIDRNATVLEPSASGNSGKYSYNGLTYDITGGEATIMKSNVSGVITIPNEINGYPVTSIDDWAFWHCYGLTSVTIPDSVTSIGNGAFQNCTGLTSITIPDSVESIGNSAFYNCTGLTSITIPDSVTSIGGDDFYNTAWYNNQPDGLVYAGKVAYKYKGSMPSNTSITLMDDTKGIADSAFYKCAGLTSITIPDSVTSIGGYAFYYCTGLTSITIPDSVTSIGSYAFYNTAWYNNQPDGLVYAGKVAYKYKGSMPINTNIALKDDTKGIAGSAFDDCYGLTSVTIPDSVTSIGSCAFSGCSNIYHIFYSGTQEQWNSIQIDSSNSCLTVPIRHYECKEENYTVGTVAPVCLSRGYDYFCCNICGKIYKNNLTDSTGVHTYTDEGKCSECDRYIESAHNYADNEDKSWTVTRKGSSKVTITFSDNTYLGYNRDFIYFYDKNGAEVGKYTGSALANKSVSVDGDTAVIRLVSDEFDNFYGFTITNIVFEMGDFFTDLPENEWFTDSCIWCSENGYMLGTDSTTFAPNATLTRAMLVMILARIDGVKLDAITYSGKFADVKSSDWFAKAVQWAIDNNITNGMSEVAFAPNGAVTREQVAKFFMSYAKYKGYSTTKSTSLGNFTDFNKVSSWALSAVKWAVAEGLISGTTETTLSPKSSATRAQAAVIFKRFVENYVAKQK